MILMSLLSDDVNESRGKNVFLYKTLESVCEHVSNNANDKEIQTRLICTRAYCLI